LVTSQGSNIIASAYVDGWRKARAHTMNRIMRRQPWEYSTHTINVASASAMDQKKMIKIRKASQNENT
jgi:hypothetical protein